jgi:hypothetical protein
MAAAPYALDPDGNPIANVNGENSAPGGWVWDPVHMQWMPAPEDLSAAAPDAGVAAPGAGTAQAPSFGAFDETFSAPDQSGLPGLPGVGPAPAFNFRAPSVDEALNDPGYQFVVGQGTDALQRWAAAKGTLNDSPTGEALINYGQSAATQQYKNVWDRMFSVAREAYAPQLQTWQAQNQRSALGYSTEAEWNQHANDMNYQNAWKKFLNDEDLYKWNVDTALRTAGA